MKKLLLVEDDPFILKMYKKKFEISGFEVQVSQNGEDGVKMMKSFLPDIVLMDIMMPKLNGLDALVQIKADPAIKDIPVLILTNLSTADDAQAAIERGALKYLIKSEYTPVQILEVVKDILKIQ